MYEIIFYRDSSGKQAVLEYMEKLRTIRSKDSRIKLNKINDYVTALSVYGKELLTGNYVKHLEGEIWELRPLRERILFAEIVGGKYVLLHRFTKQTQKTPRREIEKAKLALTDFKERSGLYE
ncbi:MAG TPA: type II toxin-antitoxin system RelE/ParE family toxin [Bacillota bacterium]|nr:type II toxin-antitoxin system RelE/ParE family toxin [Bacillota bacterium]